MATASPLSRSSRFLQILRLALIFLGAFMLVLDIIGAVSRKDIDAAVMRSDRPASMKKTGANKAFNVERFLPDIFTMVLYILVLVLVHRSNRNCINTSPSVLTVLHVFFTLFVSGFLMFAPFKLIDSIQIFVDKISLMGPLDGNPGSTEWYFCYRRPTPEQARETDEPVMWFWSGCVVARVRDIVAILTALLILIELAWSLRVAYRKNNNGGRKELLDVSSVDDDHEKN